MVLKDHIYNMLKLQSLLTDGARYKILLTLDDVKKSSILKNGIGI